MEEVLVLQAEAGVALPGPLENNGLAQRISSLTDRLSGVFSDKKVQEERRLLRIRNEQRQLLRERMAKATTYEEWERTAQQLDGLEQNEEWKRSDSCGPDDERLYRPDVITARLRELEEARASGDVGRMLHVVRTALSRNVGGISSSGLYSHTHTGTKRLVERYVQASMDLIEALVQSKTLPPGLTARAMLEQVQLARTSYGRSAVVLSGGSVYGMAHIGVLKALFERQLLPRIISGTSAGSIVAAVVCTRTDEEIPGVLQIFAHGDLAVFTDEKNPDSWLTHVGRVLRYGSWHDSRHLARVMRGVMGDVTFQEAFNRTRRILNIAVSSSKPGLQLPPLLNYLTAPDVIVWSAVVASCSIPGVFDPRPLLVRDADTGEHVPWDPAEQLWIDGSLDNDVPVERLGEMLNVNHFIVSQANPHIVLFVQDSHSEPPPPTSTSSASASASASSSSSSSHSSVSRFISTLAWLSKSEAVYCMESLVRLGLFRGSLGIMVQMLNQRYTADINILPRMSLTWGTHLIRNPTPEFMLEACRVGEQATWPSLCRIRHTCAVELALDRAVFTLRERIAFSDSQVNLRRIITGAANKSPSAVRLHHRRRKSSGSLHLLSHRQRVRRDLETILSEDGGRDSEDLDTKEREQSRQNGPHHLRPSLADRRGLTDMSLATFFGVSVKQHTSLQHLPMSSKTPSPGTSFIRKSYGFGSSLSGGLTPFTTTTTTTTANHTRDNSPDGTPALHMRSEQRRRRGSSVSSAMSTVSAMSSAAVAAVTAAHQLFLQAMGGSSPASNTLEGSQPPPLVYSEQGYDSSIGSEDESPYEKKPMRRVVRRCRSDTVVMSSRRMAQTQTEEQEEADSCEEEFGDEDDEMGDENERGSVIFSRTLYGNELTTGQ